LQCVKEQTSLPSAGNARMGSIVSVTPSPTPDWDQLMTKASSLSGSIQPHKQDSKHEAIHTGETSTKRPPGMAFFSHRADYNVHSRTIQTLFQKPISKGASPFVLPVSPSFEASSVPGNGPSKKIELANFLPYKGKVTSEDEVAFSTTGPSLQRCRCSMRHATSGTCCPSQPCALYPAPHTNVGATIDALNSQESLSLGSVHRRHSVDPTAECHPLFSAGHSGRGSSAFAPGFFNDLG
jgi:hypothetical protein